MLRANILVLRSSQAPHQTLECSRDEWAVFVEAVKAGEFDLDTF